MEMLLPIIAPGLVPLMLFAAAAYLLFMLPTIIASTRGVPNVGGVALVNLLAGWTAIGWIAALVMACVKVEL